MYTVSEHIGFGWIRTLEFPFWNLRRYFFSINIWLQHHNLYYLCYDPHFIAGFLYCIGRIILWKWLKNGYLICRSNFTKIYILATVVYNILTKQMLNQNTVFKLSCSAYLTHTLRNHNYNTFTTRCVRKVKIMQ